MAKTYTSKACEVLSVLTEQQKHRFLAFLTGELGKDTHPVHRLGAYVVRTVKKDRLMIDAAVAWQQLYAPKPAPAEDSRKLSQHMSTLGRYAEEFLAIERFRSQAPLKRIHTIEALNEHKLGHLNGYHLQRLREELDQAEVIHPEHYQWVYKADRLLQYQFVSRQEGVDQALDGEYFLKSALKSSLLDILRAVKQYHLYTDTNKGFLMIKNITPFITISGINNDTLITVLTQDCMDLARAHSSISLIDKELSRLKEQFTYAPVDTRQDAFIHVQNLAVRYLYQYGTREARKLVWEVSHYGVSAGLATAYGNRLSLRQFKWFVNAAIWSGEVTRQQLQDIIQSDQMRRLLPEMEGTEELLFCEAYYDMLEGDYRTVVARLEAARFIKSFDKIEAKVLIAKALYEHMYATALPPNAFDLETFLNKVAYAKRMLAELTNLDVRFRDLFQEELSFLAQLVRAVTREQLLHLREKIDQSAVIGYHRFWYQEKVEQRLAALD